MFRFSQKVYDNYVTGTQSVYSDTALSELLGSVDHLALIGFVDGVTGTSPTLTVQSEHSFDGARWMNRNATPEINNWGPLSPGSNNVVPFSDGSALTKPILPRVRLRIQLGGTSPAGVVRLWVVGRDPAR
jgi:hypothetical protein